MALGSLVRIERLELVGLRHSMMRGPGSKDRRYTARPMTGASYECGNLEATKIGSFELNSR